MPKSTKKTPHTREICRIPRERCPLYVKGGVLHWYGLILYSKIEILLKREGQFITQEAGEKKSDETICYKKAFYCLVCKFFNLFCRLTLPDPTARQQQADNK